MGLFVVVGWTQLWMEMQNHYFDFVLYFQNLANCFEPPEMQMQLMVVEQLNQIQKFQLNLSVIKIMQILVSIKLINYMIEYIQVWCYFVQMHIVWKVMHQMWLLHQTQEPVQNQMTLTYHKQFLENKKNKY